MSYSPPRAVPNNLTSSIGMPSITVSKGMTLYYEDCGIPFGTSHYTTVFLIHGLVFHTPIFRHLFPYAAAHNLRLVSINVPGYPSSSPLSDEQATSLTSGEVEKVESAFFELSKIIASGIAHLIQTEHLPPPTNGAGSKVGGVRILGWSAGNVFLLSLLANLHFLDNDVNSVLERYVTSVIIYEVPCVMIGEPRPTVNAYSPIEDPEVPQSEFTNHFMTWISSYFQPFADLHAITPSALEKRKDMVELSSDPAHSSTVSRMTSEELQAITYPAVFARNPTPLADPAITQVYAHNFQRAILDTKGAWPNVDVLALWGDMSPFYISWAVKVISQAIQQPVGNNEQRRNVRIVKIENANHFLHYEDPERMVSILADNATAPANGAVNSARRPRARRANL